ncbi:MAG: outer membrane protein assembly factor BamA [Paracoccus sp. (in: a-proteobacteria)]|nr:outer membrane protein assembly factor BamA [Paracoccus sp. (in: a-proteobacteria)]
MTALAVTVPVGAAPALAQAAYSFTQVRIEGNQRIEPETILSYANVQRGQPVTPGQLNDALQRLQGSGLFETVEIIPQGGTLLIRVREYPTINIINFEGNRRIQNAQLSEVIQSASRRVYSPAQAERDAANIAQLYSSQGRLAARVTPRIIERDGNRVDLVFEIREGNVTEIERIGFTGNRAFSDRRLRNVLDTKQAGLLRTFIRRDTFNPDRLELDERLLTDFYRSRGYADMRVRAIAPEIARERDAFFITFAIEEGPRFTMGRIDTISEIPGVDAAAFAAENRVRPGEVYNPAVIDNTIRRMETVALREGRDFINIEPRITRNMRNQTLDLTFALTRGPRVFVERIDIEGNTTTLDEVIRRQFRTVEGDPFNPREIRNSAERIRALGFFADAQVGTREGSSPQQVIVDVNVEEQPTGSLTFGVSYGVETGPGLNIGLEERNFLGRGQQVGLNIATAKGNRDSSFNFVEPHFLGRDLRARLSGWYRETNQFNARYNTRSAGFSTGVEFPVSENGRLELTYRLSKDSIFDVTAIGVDDEGRDIGSSPILVEEQGGLWTSALGYAYNYDSRRLGLDPQNAYRFRLGQEYAGLGGDRNMIRTTVFAGMESTAWRDEVTLRFEFEAGAVHMLDGQVSRVTDRFTGSRVRGFGANGYGPRDLNAPNEDALGGNYFWVARAEAQFPIGIPEEYGVMGGLFADVGSVWGLDNVQGHPVQTGEPPHNLPGGIVDDSMNVRASVGASMFWTTPLGPLRFNYAVPVRKVEGDREQRFDLTISTQF